MLPATRAVPLPARVGRGRTAAAFPAAAAVASGAAIALHAVAPAGGPHLRFADLLAGVSFSLAGTMVLRRDPGNAAGRLLAGTAVLALGPVANELAWRLLGSHPHSVATDAALWVTNWIWIPYLLLPTLLVLLLPSGRLPSPRWRPVAAAVCLLTVAAAVCAMLRPGGADQITTADNPFGLAGASFLGPALAVAVLLVLLLGAVCVGGVFVRQRRASGEEAAQLRWLSAGAASAVSAFVGSVAAPWPFGELLLGAGLVALPVAIAVATWRHRLYDAQGVLNRAVTSFVLTAIGLGLYGIVVAASERLAPAVAAVLALTAAVTWRSAQRLTQRLLYGSRDEPFTVVARIGSQIDAVSAPTRALQALVETVCDALRLPYVAVTGSHHAASAGAPVADVDEFPCIANGRAVATSPSGTGTRASAGTTMSGRCWSTARGVPARWWSPVGSSRISSNREMPWWPRARRSGAVCVTTCTTGSHPRWPGSRCSWTFSTSAARGRSPRRSGTSATAREPWPTRCARSSTTSGRRRSTSWGWWRRCARTPAHGAVRSG